MAVRMQVLEKLPSKITTWALSVWLLCLFKIQCGPFEMWLRIRSRAFMNGIGVLLEEDPESWFVCFCLVMAQGEGFICDPESGPLADTKSAKEKLILISSFSRTARNKFLLCLSHLFYSILLIAWTNGDKCLLRDKPNQTPKQQK